MTNAAYAIHDEIVQRGATPDHDSYYETIDRRMREEFPHKFRSEDTDSSPSKPVTTVVTPGGNETSRSKKVRLSPSQVAVANGLVSLLRNMPSSSLRLILRRHVNV